ncbi:Transcription factor Adf-1 [Anabarilius grahami]|uniref:Transcription factor Adf-1 n=1 Tax=Anabarilius grahami TaxID=495550 RepID=A0A3N0Y451_ANAGA|nr:Transcription factor Adf-1 [Anabarilius grahami]
MDAELLLFLVSENKELFDKNHSEYKNTKRKEVLWQGIADKMGVDVEEVKAKWKNLRDTYTRKKRLEQDGSRSGRAAKKKKQWKYMRVMDFLDPSTEHRSVPGKIEDDEPDEDSGAEPASTSTGTSMTSPGAIRSGIVKRRRSETLELLERYLASKDSRDREKDEQQQDEVDLFLRSLAPALRRLPASKQSLVKLQIQKILHDAEFGQPSFPQISSVSPSNQLLLQCSVVKPS